MQDLKAELLRGLWYVALVGDDLRRGRIVHKTLLGEPVLIARDGEGEVFALRDICPHRGIPLHYGRLDGTTVACCYHGWRFDRHGACIEIPSLREGQEVDVGKIRCGAYPCVEQQGLIWVYFPRPEETSPMPPAPPLHAGISARRPAGGQNHAAVSVLHRSRRLRADGSDPRRLRAYVLVVQAPGQQAAAEGEAVRAERARLADGAPPAAAAEHHLQAARPQRGDRDQLSVAGAAHRGGARRSSRRGRPHRHHPDHRRGDRGAPDLLGDPALGRRRWPR